MSEEHSPHDDSLTDADLDAVVGGGSDTATHWGCGLAKTLGDSSHSNQSVRHVNAAGTYMCDGSSGYTITNSGDYYKVR